MAGADGGPWANPLLFPPRGDERPVLHQVLSAPALRSDFLGDVADDRAEGHHEDYRQGFRDMLGSLDRQMHKRRRDEQRHRQASKFMATMQATHAQSLKDARSMEQKPAFITKNKPGYFEPPAFEGTGSEATDRKELLKGVYHETGQRARRGTAPVDPWRQHLRNDKHEALAEFGTKRRDRMLPTERKFAERLDVSLAAGDAAARRDMLRQTTGSLRRKAIEEGMDEHSCMRRTKAPWTAQQISTHMHFSNPEPYKPGERSSDSALDEYVTQLPRAYDSSPGMVAGDGSTKSHWHPPTGAMDTTKRKEQADALFRQYWTPKADLTSSKTLSRSCITNATSAAPRATKTAHFAD